MPQPQRPTREPDHVFVLHLALIEGSDKATSGHNKFWIGQFWENEGIGQRNWGKLSKPIEQVLAAIKSGEKVGQQKIEYTTLRKYESDVRKRTDPNGTSSAHAVVKYGKPYKRMNLVSASDVQVVDNGAPVKSTAIVAIDPQVHKFVQTITDTTRRHIQTHFQGDVAAMSAAHIQDARQIIEGAAKIMPDFTLKSTASKSVQLDDAVRAYLAMPSGEQVKFRGIMNDYFSTIPTVLPRNTAAIVDQIAGQFMLNLMNGEIEDRLEQLETAAKIAVAQQRQPQQAIQQSDPVAIAYSQMGCILQPVSPGSQVFAEIKRRFEQRNGVGSVVRARIDSMFAVHIPSERDAFIASSFGKTDNNGNPAVLPLFHGTRTPNTQHILRTGLLIKKVADNGSRFGRGLYHSSAATRSWQYTDQSRRVPNIMFVSHVAVGTPYRDNGSNSRIDLNWIKSKQAHSVLGEGEWGRQGDEFITYTAEQSTISYALVLSAA